MIIRPKHVIKNIKSTPRSATIIDTKIPATKFISTRPRNIIKPGVRLKQNVVNKKTYNYGLHKTRHMIPRRHMVKKETHEKLLSIKNIGLNKILVIVAPGPSSLKINVEDLVNYSNVDVMTINKPDLRIWPTKYWLAIWSAPNKSANETAWQALRITVRHGEYHSRLIYTIKQGVV